MKSIKDQLFTYWWSKWYDPAGESKIDLEDVAKEAWKAGFEKGYQKALAYCKIAEDDE